jgi:hypothetical protein
MTQAGRVDERAKYYLIVLTAALLIPAALGSSKSIFNDGDVSWHIATGQWILAHGQIPRTDQFSFTWTGKPWVPIEWLAETIMASAYRFAGYSGISALATAALIALHAVIVSNATRFVRPLAALGAIIAMDVVLIPMMLARPHLLAWALLAFWTSLMVHTRQKDRAPPLAAALLMVVWTNLHGSFVIGLVVAAVLALEALLASGDRSRALRQWGLFGVACLIAVFVNANGLEGVLHPLKIANLSMLPLVDEWKPSNPAVTPFFFVVLAGVLALIWVKRPAMHPVRWVLLCALLGLALLQVRHQAVLAIVAAVILPEAFAKGSARGEAEGKVWWLVGAAAATLIVVRLFMPMTPPENEANPWNLIAAVPPDLRSQPVMNGYVMGGPLILSGIRTYVDGRGDMYGDELVIGYKSITDGDAAKFEEEVQRWGIRWAILPHRYKKLVALIDRSPGWKRIHQDEVGVIYVRD